MALSLCWWKNLALPALSKSCLPLEIRQQGVHTLHFGHHQKLEKSFKNKKLMVFRKNISLSCFSWSDGDKHEGDMHEKDSNDLALERLDITLLKPHPEWRNVAAGPVWGDGYYELLWKDFLEKDKVALDREMHDNLWNEYVEKHGYSPAEYLETADYKELYGEHTVWHNYFRRFKGTVQRQRTRESCMRQGKMATGSPCALCRDDKVLLTYKNLPLLHQFIDKETGLVHSTMRTGVCRAKQKLIDRSLELGKELGLLPRRVHFVRYNLNDYRSDYPSL